MSLRVSLWMPFALWRRFVLLAVMCVVCGRALAQGVASDPTNAAAQRCLELGGTMTACAGSSLLGGLVSTFTGGIGLGLNSPTREGVVLNGMYGRSASGATVSFDGDTMTIGGCGKLVPDAKPYTLAKSAGVVKVSLANDPSPIVLTMRSDGSLAGPGAVTVKGRVISRYDTVTSTQMINGVRAAPGQCNGPCQTVSQAPVYADATVTCTLGALAAPPPPASAAASASGSDSSGLGGLLGAITDVVSTVAPVSPPGLRMEGRYAGSGGLILDFAGDAVTMDCGRAHIKAPYTVANGANAYTISVQNPGGAFSLSLSSSNTLSGSGSTTVNGRLFAGLSGNQATFTPHSETCTVATLKPSAAGKGDVVASAGPKPAAPASGPPVSMKVNVTSTFPTAANPLAGRLVTLMTERFDTALREGGATIPANMTPGQALQTWAYFCTPPKDCSAAAKVMEKYYVGRGTFDNSGKVVVSATLAPGSYYVFTSVAGTKGALVWDMPITLQAGGDNTINLTATNAELVPTTAAPK